MDMFVKVRSTRPPVAARLHNNTIAGKIRVELKEGEPGIAPGQACVFYADDNRDSRVLGGGFIDRTGRDPDIEQALSTVLKSSPAHA